MKIDIVLVTTNENPLYYTFYPYVKKFWEKLLNVKCVLIYVGKELPETLVEFKDDIIIFDPIININTAFIAQNIRLLYPCILTNCSNGILISDIDMVPLNKKYFLEKINNLPDDSFINYTWEPTNISINQYYMCYNVANFKVWREIFNVSSIDDINQTLMFWYSKIDYHFDEKYRSKCKGFFNDQLMLYKYVNYWNNLVLDKNLSCNENNITQALNNIYIFNKDIAIKCNRLFLLPLDNKRYVIHNSFNKSILNEDLKNIYNFDDFHIPKNFNKILLNSILDKIQ